MVAKVKRSRHPSPGLEVGHNFAKHIPGARALKVKLIQKRWGQKTPTYLRRCKERKAIFVRTPKNASTSLCKFIFPDLTEPDWPPHYSADCYRALVPDLYASATVIAPMREPIARLMSAFNWYRHSSPVAEERHMLQSAIGGDGTFDDFLKYLADAPDLDALKIMQWHHFRRQTDFITARDGRIIVDYLFPVEDMRPGLRKLQKLFGTSGEITRQHVSGGSNEQPDIPDNVLAYCADDRKLWKRAMEKRLYRV